MQSDEVLFTILRHVWAEDAVREWPAMDLVGVLVRQPLLRYEFVHMSVEARVQKAFKIILDNRHELPKCGWVIDSHFRRLSRTCLAELHRDYDHCEECYNKVECLSLPIPIWN